MQALISGFTPLCHKIAKKYSTAYDEQELLNNMNEFLYDAIRNFNPSKNKNAQFFTYLHSSLDRATNAFIRRKAPMVGPRGNAGSQYGDYNVSFPQKCLSDGWLMAPSRNPRVEDPEMGSLLEEIHCLAEETLNDIEFQAISQWFGLGDDIRPEPTDPEHPDKDSFRINRVAKSMQMKPHDLRDLLQVAMIKLYNSPQMKTMAQVYFNIEEKI